MGVSAVEADLLPPRLVELIKERGWKDLTEVQKKAFKPITEGKNVLIVAPTGYGKTEAAMLPIFAKMIEERPEPLSVLYITPLKSLINDLKNRIEWWAERLGFVVARKHGDVGASERSLRLKRTPHILLTTPEGFKIDLDWASQFRKYYKNVRWVVVDEAHELVGSKRGVQLSLLLERLKAYSGRDYQRIALSATVGDPEATAKLLFGSSSREKEIVKVNVKRKIELVVDSIGEAREEDSFWKASAKKILEHVEPPTLVFVNTRYAAERLHEELSKIEGLKVEVHHSSISKEIRQEIEKNLKDGKLDVVIATKTLELGIDISDLNKVILFKPPGSVASLLQRVGRAGHKLGGVSRGVIITTDEIEALDGYTEAVLAVKGIVEPPKVPDAPLDVLAREIIGMTLQEKRLDPSWAYEVVKGAYPYRNLTKETFDELINVLVKNKILAWDGDKLKVSYMFYKLWSFDGGEKKRWSRSFGEFFSVISERDVFVVKWGNKVVGDLDAFYVYKYLRPESKIRLGGKTWKVIGIDDEGMKVYVEPATDQMGEIPLWKGEEFHRSSLIPEYAKRVLEEEKPKEVKLLPDAEKKVRKVFESYKRKNIDLPGGDVYYLEKVPGGYVLTGFMDQRLAEALAHLIMYKVSSEYTTAVSVRSSFTGIAVTVDGGEAPNPIKLLKEIDDVEDAIRKAMERSPYLVQTAKEIQLSFGKLGKVTPDDGLVFEEAVKQAIEKYIDVEKAKKFIEMLKEKKIKVKLIKAKSLTPLAAHVMSLPAFRPWLKIIEARIVSLLKGEAFTAEELATMLDLSPTTVENKLKEMRKPTSKARVVHFIDVEFGETRWCLLEDLDEIMKKDEYATSFKPLDPYENFTMFYRTSPKDEYNMKYFKPLDIINNAEEFLRSINADEFYEVKVMFQGDPLFKNLVPRYFYVPKKALPAVLLNAVAYIQRVRRSA
ncbi:DEAD/DEAH box helicase domain protein [Ignicoccus hospitalis KIN4/I]|uniref:DEAD/DEAH box helicase domain protein n=1 Tax=Ignicoccus hospitalis (strain KIN4/I / DSM 18386 / JCM 14125) TaxID=453591 RepID=A8A8X3_IGNH4|nr:DEAD/DEAH box helicase domain protein [Ignicoccus hospitalis KIN4/I]